MIEPIDEGHCRHSVEGEIIIKVFGIGRLAEKTIIDSTIKTFKALPAIVERSAAAPSIPAHMWPSHVVLHPGGGYECLQVVTCHGRPFWLVLTLTLVFECWLGPSDPPRQICCTKCTLGRGEGNIRWAIPGIPINGSWKCLANILALPQG